MLLGHVAIIPSRMEFGVSSFLPRHIPPHRLPPSPRSLRPPPLLVCATSQFPESEVRPWCSRNSFPVVTLQRRHDQATTRNQALSSPSESCIRTPRTPSCRLRVPKTISAGSGPPNLQFQPQSRTPVAISSQLLQILLSYLTGPPA